MSISLTKVAIGLGSVSGVAGLGYLSSSYLIPAKDKKVSIFKLFKEQGRTLLTKGENIEQWNSRWKSYVEGGKNIWNLKDYESTKANTTTASESFIDKCISNSQIEVSGMEDPLYQQVVEHCSKEFKISELVNRNSGFTALSTDGSSDEEAWKSAWQSYLDDNANSNPWELSKSNWDSVKANRTSLPSDFKSKCKSKADETAFWEKDSKFLNFTRWCSKPH
ncbi:hypothetical protein MHC_04855 [Mycoplasma haemocanis str. Illinois]|uniref:Uncharacterized protein n=1 Tax=Mycoplasma haemocanis (strain Illinois) TaxID=1111676 RepID=H6N855_MYCHN|nr:hypothetical protein [Mycoplasma haemocanis]AEW45827.1 hypothetical protein MHC_04855 [Mycoplasma haemocanis str. Illinois]